VIIHLRWVSLVNIVVNHGRRAIFISFIYVLISELAILLKAQYFACKVELASIEAVCIR